MYHYKEIGLRNVWLANGYRTIDTEYGKATAIEDVEGLHQTISKSMATSKPRLTGAEFRFLRKELCLSQAGFGDLFGLQAQTVALWERGKQRVPKWADRMIRVLYLESIGGNDKVNDLIKRLNDIDQQRLERKQIFQETAKGWVPKAA